MLTQTHRKVIVKLIRTFIAYVWIFLLVRNKIRQTNNIVIPIISTGVTTNIFAMFLGTFHSTKIVFPCNS